MKSPVLITGILWLVADLFWWMAAGNTKATVALGQKPAARRAHVTSLLLGFALCYLPLGSVPILGYRVVPGDGFVSWSGVGLCAAGVAFAIWARSVLASNWSGAVTLKQDHRLIQEGPFRWIRHPIYLGFMTAMIGTALAVGQVRAFFLLLSFFGLYMKIQAEERLLRAAFPAEYSAYQGRTWKLVPWLW